MPLSYKTEGEYIAAGDAYYKEYRSERYLLKMKPNESENFKYAELCYQKAHKLNPNSFTPINSLLAMYWDVNVPDKFFEWIDILTQTENDKYSNYIYACKYCIDIAKRTNADIRFLNVRINLQEFDNNLYGGKLNIGTEVDALYKKLSNPSEQNMWTDSVQNLGVEDKSFGYRLWEKAIECLDNAYKIKPTSEILNLYSTIYSKFGEKVRIGLYSRDEDRKLVTKVVFSAREDNQKAQEYLEKALSFENNWQSHYTIFKNTIYEEAGYTGFNIDNASFENLMIWGLSKNYNKVPDLLYELDAAIDIAEGTDKYNLINEKANIYVCLGKFDEAKKEYTRNKNFTSDWSYLNRQLSNCEIFKHNYAIYQQCASVLGLINAKQYLIWKRRNNSDALYRYLNIGSSPEQYEENDFILMPAQKLALIDVDTERNNYVYLVSGQGVNQLSQYCKIISPVQINTIYFHEYLNSEPLILQFVKKDAYQNGVQVKECDLFRNIAKGTKEYDDYYNKLVQIEKLQKNLKNIIK